MYSSTYFKIFTTEDIDRWKSLGFIVLEFFFMRHSHSCANRKQPL